jgi:molybdate transport system substrate-binding protein
VFTPEKTRKRPPTTIGRPLAAVLAAVMVLGCGGGDDGGRAPATTTATGPLRVAAASDLLAACPSLVEAFRTETGLDVVFIPGASGQLAQQISQGAPFDVFLSADRAFVTGLVADGSIRADSVRPYAIGTLVIVVNRASGAKVEKLADLAGPGIRHVAIANPDFAPYGRAARQTLERAGLWEPLTPKLVQAESVRQTLQFVQTGNAEAGLVGYAVAGVPEVHVVRLDIEPAPHDPIVQTLGVTTRSARADDAEAFARFLLGPAGQAILARFGFRPPPSQP